jgi:hypothetical protein
MDEKIKGFFARLSGGGCSCGGNCGPIEPLEEVREKASADQEGGKENPQSDDTRPDSGGCDCGGCCG